MPVLTVPPSARPWLRRGLALLASALAGLVLAGAVLFILQPPRAALAQPPRAPAALSFPGCGLTLQDCINSASAGDTINIAAGSYVTSFTLNKAVSLIGAGAGSTVFTALPGQRVITVTAAMTTSTQIADMTLQGGAAGGLNGGGIGLNTHAEPLLLNLTINLNSASIGGGIFATSAITLSNVTVSNNTATNGSGGGLYANGTVLATGGVFQNNAATAGGGGLYSGAGLNLSGTQVLSNTAGNGNGGGAWTTVNAVVTGTYFAYNQVLTTGNSGGLDTAGSLFATDATFARNRNLHGNGGGSGAGGNVTLNNVSYLSNSAVSGGGLLTFGLARIAGSQLLSNTASNLGGGLYAADARVSGSLFQGNNALGSWGGGFFAVQTAAVTDTRFITNSGAYAGGGLATQFGACSVLGGRFERNTATTGGAGGGVYCGGAWLSISGTLFLSNVASDTGGGVLGNTIWVTNTEFAHNSAANYAGGLESVGPGHILNSLFQDNHASLNGGAMSSGASFAVIESSFFSNTAHGDGTYGGGAVAAAGSITAARSHFAGNSADTSPGGALDASGGLFLAYSDFTGNSAVTGDGGAAFAASGASLDHVLMTGNQAALNGGGLAVTGTLTISSSRLTGNFANNGGGLYQYAGDGRLVNSLFAGNTALSLAGMQLNLAPTGLQQIWFSTVGAPSPVSGDAILIRGGTVELRNVIVTNHALGLHRTGGAVSQDYNLFFGNTTPIFGIVSGGLHNASGDPDFIGPAGGNYHLGLASAALDAGLDLGVTTDIDGQTRPLGPGFDLGYDEAVINRLFLPLVRR